MDDFNQVIQAVDQGYIRGIHKDGDRELIEQYFHNEFSMFLRDDSDNISIMKIQEWIERIEKRKKDNPDAYKDRNVGYKIRDISVNGVFASVVLDLFYDDKLYAVDQFLLYKLNGKWQFMAKVYEM